MGTRHLICVVKDDEYKVAQYGQWDGYPSGQGLGILDFLKNEMDRETFEKKVSEISFLTKEESQIRWDECGANGEKWVSIEVSDKYRKLYPENCRDTGSDILLLIQESDKPLKLVDSLDFAGDSLFCEYAYVIDLDKNTYEVYEGFNQKPLDKDERFISLERESKHGEKYYPVKHLISFRLNNLPTREEFLKLTEREDEE